MSQELDPPMPRDVVTAVKMFGAMILLWLIGSVTVHTLLWYRVVPDLRAVPRACGPAPGETTWSGASGSTPDSGPGATIPHAN